MVPLPAAPTGSWSLLFYDQGNHALISPIPGTEITALFEDGRLRGHSGCNRYTTTFDAEGPRLRIAPPVGTRMMCALPEGVMTQEAAYLGLLPRASTYQIVDDRLLNVFETDGACILQFVKT